MSEYSIKLLNHEDLIQFQELLIVFEEAFEMKEFKLPNDNHLQNLLAKTDFMCFVVQHENKVVGGLTVYVLTSYFHESSDAYILDLAVKSDFQRQGLGKKLMETIFQHCKKLKFKEVFVQADEVDQHAVDFYRSMGGIAENAVNFDYPLNH